MSHLTIEESVYKLSKVQTQATKVDLLNKTYTKCKPFHSNALSNNVFKNRLSNTNTHAHIQTGASVYTKLVTWPTLSII